ncbi:MAG: AMP-binding protein [Proteobacteria bacterium]|nr:AMP-binding protein [Pseudomonadota bacterium]
MRVARKNLPYICNDRPRNGLFALEYKLADRLVFSKIRKHIGMDKVTVAISGGGPLSVPDAEFFLGMGIKVLEGFGMTETTAGANINRIDKIKIGTVGPPIKDSITKIDADGEVLVRGPQVMKGYYKNEDATMAAFTEDGFLRTGDIGLIDSDGYLRITGRKKELIITSSGKNISPQNLENSIKNSPFVDQVVIIGDNRNYLSALVVPELYTLEVWARSVGIVFADRKSLIENESVKDLFNEEIKKNMEKYSRIEQIKIFRLIDREWSQDTEELTPTLKVKRQIINTKYKKEIEDMYPHG